MAVAVPVGYKTEIFWIWVHLVYGFSSSLRIVEISGPKEAALGSDVSLSCHYVLESEELYSVNWYLNGSEMTDLRPEKRQTPVAIDKKPGEPRVTQINQVELKNINFSFTGLYKCEVSAEATFQVDWMHHFLRVYQVRPSHSAPVEYPQVDLGWRDFHGSNEISVPKVFIETREYHVGDLVRANCSLSMARKYGAVLQWKLPKTWLSKRCPYQIKKHIHTQALGLSFNVQPCHLDKNNTITISCKAIAVKYMDIGQFMNCSTRPFGMMILRCVANTVAAILAILMR